MAMDAQMNDNFGSRGCFRKASSPQSQPHDNSHKPQRMPGGWKTMPYILGNETFERLASTGLLANFMVYLRKVYHLNQVSAASLINIWSIANNFTPVLGAFISDAYLGRFYTISIGSTISILGMVGMTFTAWILQLHPPKCNSPLQATSQCKGPITSQIGFLIMSLCLLSIGSGGIRPCSVPFGVDQFDATTEKGRNGLGSFYNWYYATFSIILVFTATVVVYIQDSVSWVLGYGIPTLLMFFAIVLFFLGTRVYVYMKPDGSVFTGLAQVFVANYKKRKLKLPSHAAIDNTTFYDPPLDSNGTADIPNLPLTTQYRFLNKAAIVLENELNPDGTRANKWSLCSIQQVEEFKCIVRVVPIWASTILCLLTIIQQGTFSVSQALQMDRQLGRTFKVPAASIGAMSYLTLAVWVPLYDRVIVTQLRKITKHPNGITQLQRIGIGSVFAVMAMVVAGIIEKERRDMAHHQNRQMSVFWLFPQHILIGLCEAFSIIGQMEFLNNEFPEHLRTMANALLSISFTIAAYVSTLVVIILHKTTGGTHGKPDWLTNDLNAGRLDYYYYIVAGIAFFNLFLFVYCATRYQYKGAGETQAVKPMDEVELSSKKELDVSLSEV